MSLNCPFFSEVTSYVKLSQIAKKKLKGISNELQPEMTHLLIKKF